MAIEDDLGPENYLSTFDYTSEGVFQIDNNGRLVSANLAMARLFGYSTPAELIESTPEMIHLFADPVRYEEMIRLLEEHDSLPDFEALIKHREGTPRWVSLKIHSIHTEGAKIEFRKGTMKDVTKRRKAEEALAESEERYRTVIEHSNDGIAILHEGRHLYVNPKFVEMFGYDKPEQILDKPVTFNIHPEDAERVKTINAKRIKGEEVPAFYEFRGIRQDGKTVYVEVSAAAATYRDLPVILAFLRDITDRKLSEEAFLQSHRQMEQLSRAKTKAVHHLSHELKTPLSIIQGNLRLLHKKAGNTEVTNGLTHVFSVLEKHLSRLFRIQREADEIVRTLKELEKIGLREEITRLINSLHDLGDVPKEVEDAMHVVRDWAEAYTIGRGTVENIDLCSMLSSAVDRIRTMVSSRNLVIRSQLGSNIELPISAKVVTSVINGLLKNAVENTPDGGVVTVSLDERENQIVMHVTDTGCGISEEDQAHIFDGLFPARDTDAYMSKDPFDFGAGGKGLDLLRMKVFGELHNFSISLDSQRCRFLSSDPESECPGDVALCSQCTTTNDCYSSGGTIVSVTFNKPVG
jgi:PAS domain S-box-containing protein